jgi:hypothetical protein
MGGHMIKASSMEIEEAILSWATRALQAILDKSAVVGLENLVNGITLESVRWTEVVHDLETSAHTPDDRDTYCVEGSVGQSIVRFTVDIVHKSEGVDRFGRALVFSILHERHDIEGVVILPLSEEDGAPWVDITSITNT